MGYWYDEPPPKGIPSLLQLVKAFVKEWDPNLDEETIEAMIPFPNRSMLKKALKTLLLLLIC